MDIIEFLECELKLEGKLSMSGWYRACCPIHGERTPSFAVYTHYPYYFNCFSCSCSGQLPYLTASVLKMSLDKATQFVRDRIKISIDYAKLFRESGRDEAIPDALAQAYRNALPRSRTSRYCKKRGIPRFILESFGVGHDQLNLQMMTPLWSVAESRIMGYDTRGFFTEDEPPDKSTIVPEGFSDAVVMAPLNFKRYSKVVVVEGFFDAAKVLMWLMREDKADHIPLAFGGVNISNKQLGLLSSFDRIILGHDNDAAGNRAVTGIAKRLSHVPLYRLCFDDKDPGASSLDSFEVKILI